MSSTTFCHSNELTGPGRRTRVHLRRARDEHEVTGDTKTERDLSNNLWRHVLVHQHEVEDHLRVAAVDDLKDPPMRFGKEESGSDNSKARKIWKRVKRIEQGERRQRSVQL